MFRWTENDDYSEKKTVFKLLKIAQPKFYQCLYKPAFQASLTIIIDNKPKFEKWKSGATPKVTKIKLQVMFLSFSHTHTHTISKHLVG